MPSIRRELALSVVVPAHYSATTIGATLESLKGIEFPFEVIIVENGSSELPEAMRTVDFDDAPVSLHIRRHADLSAARNLGKSSAVAQYLWFLDSDDFAVPEGINQALCEAARSCPDVILLGGLEVSGYQHTNKMKIDGETTRAIDAYRVARLHTRPWQVLIHALVLNRYSPVTGRYLFRKKFIDELALEFHEGEIHEDHFFSAAAFLSASTVLIINQTGFAKSDRPGSLSKSLSATRSGEGYSVALLDLGNFFKGRSLGIGPRIALGLLRVRLMLIRAKLGLIALSSRG